MLWLIVLLRHALTHSSDWPLLPLVTTSPSQLKTKPFWVSTQTLCVRGDDCYVCVTDCFNLLPFVCTNVTVVMQLRTGCLDAKGKGGLGLSCFILFRLVPLLLLMNGDQSGWCMWQDFYYFRHRNKVMFSLAFLKLFYIRLFVYLFIR